MMSSLKQNIREKLDYYKLWETKGLLNDYDTGQKHALMDMLKLLDEATKQFPCLECHDWKEGKCNPYKGFVCSHQEYVDWFLAVLEGAEQKS